MHLIGDDIAWILPTRTGTKTTLLALGRKDILSRDNKHWHYVNSSKLGDRRLYMNIRNPYTRLQSTWRMYYSKFKKIGVVKTELKNKYKPGDRISVGDMKENKISFEHYIRNLKKSPSKIHSNRFLQISINNMSYPVPLWNYVAEAGLSLDRFSGFVRQENLTEDLNDLGFEVIETVDEQVPEERYLGMKWFYDHPQYLGLINHRYRKDFEMFGYEMIR